MPQFNIVVRSVNSARGLHWSPVPPELLRHPPGEEKQLRHYHCVDEDNWDRYNCASCTGKADGCCQYPEYVSIFSLPGSMCLKYENHEDGAANAAFLIATELAGAVQMTNYGSKLAFLPAPRIDIIRRLSEATDASKSNVIVTESCCVRVLVGPALASNSQRSDGLRNHKLIGCFIGRDLPFTSKVLGYVQAEIITSIRSSSSSSANISDRISNQSCCCDQ